MNLRDVIGRLTFMGGKRREQADLRGLAAGTAKLARKGELSAFLEGMLDSKNQLEARMNNWLEPEQIQAAEAGAFDVCDLRVWLFLAEISEVPAIEAKELVKVTHDELDAMAGPVSSQVDMLSKLKVAFERAPDDEARENILNMTAQLVLPDAKVSDQRLVSLKNSMTDVMDEIPPSWMVRTNFSGSSNLKALVGTGLMLKGDDVAEIAPGLKLGAGWFQMGNRRTIDYADRRFTELAAMHKPVITYMARPWATPARFHEGEDIHRANTPIAGRGKWPAEWRCFVKNGEVTGVANYYGWTGEGATPQNAWNAIEAAAMAQRICDTAISRGLYGEFADTIMARKSSHPRDIEMLAEWAPEGLHATLDFLETNEGLMFLEGGPGHMPGGGGHPCAFAGQDVVSNDPCRLVASCIGVAFKQMEHVHLGDPSTWVDGRKDDAILDWEAAAALAQEYGQLSDYSLSFLDRKSVSIGSGLEP